MNREYTIQEFEKVSSYLVNNVQNVNLATDFIVGFPYETEDDHKKSIGLIDKFKFRTINISK